jgi:hypothetical protein
LLDPRDGAPLVAARKRRCGVSFGMEVPAEARQAGRQALLISQSLVERLHPHPRLEVLHDVIVELSDRRGRHLPQPPIGQLREPALDRLCPLLHALRGPSRDDAHIRRRPDIFPQRLAIHPRLCGIPLRGLPHASAPESRSRRSRRNVLLAIGLLALSFHWGLWAGRCA